MKRLLATIAVISLLTLAGCTDIQHQISDIVSNGEGSEGSSTEPTLTTTAAAEQTDPLILEFSDTTLALEKSSIKVGIGEKRQIVIAQCPEGYEDKLVWSSSHPAYATVDANGTVTGHANGVSTISVSIEGAGVYQSITVYVN